MFNLDFGFYKYLKFYHFRVKMKILQKKLRKGDSLSKMIQERLDEVIKTFYIIIEE